MAKQPQARYGPRPLSMMVRQAMQPALRKRTYTEATLILDWEKIMAPGFAKLCAPKKLMFPRGAREGGILTIVVDSGSSLLIQHSAPLIIDWINAYFGYCAIKALKLVHHAPSSAVVQHARKSVKIEEFIVADCDIDTISDTELKAAFYRFKAYLDAEHNHCK